MRKFIVFVIVGCLAGCHGYKLGAPMTACEDMTPHHNAQAQTSPAPYNISVSSNKYGSGDKITVTLTALTPDTLFFEGFFIQARKHGSTDSVPIGSFSFSSPDSEMKLMKCPKGKSDNNAATHTSSSHKTTKSVSWSNSGGEDVYFQVTMVNHKETFWLNLRSDKITGDGTNSAPRNVLNVFVFFALFAKLLL